jgi:hypothetical protein
LYVIEEVAGRWIVHSSQLPLTSTPSSIAVCSLTCRLATCTSNHIKLWDCRHLIHHPAYPPLPSAGDHRTAPTTALPATATTSSSVLSSIPPSTAPSTSSDQKRPTVAALPASPRGSDDSDDDTPPPAPIVIDEDKAWLLSKLVEVRMVEPTWASSTTTMTRAGAGAGGSVKRMNDETDDNNNDDNDWVRLGSNDYRYGSGSRNGNDDDDDGEHEQEDERTEDDKRVAMIRRQGIRTRAPTSARSTIGDTTSTNTTTTGSVGMVACFRESARCMMDMEVPLLIHRMQLCENYLTYASATEVKLLYLSLDTPPLLAVADGSSLPVAAASAAASSLPSLSSPTSVAVTAPLAVTPVALLKKSSGMETKGSSAASSLPVTVSARTVSSPSPMDDSFSPTSPSSYISPASFSLHLPPPLPPSSSPPAPSSSSSSSSAPSDSILETKKDTAPVATMPDDSDSSKRVNETQQISWGGLARHCVSASFDPSGTPSMAYTSTIMLSLPSIVAETTSATASTAAAVQARLRNQKYAFELLTRQVDGSQRIRVNEAAGISTSHFLFALVPVAYLRNRYPQDIDYVIVYHYCIDDSCKVIEFIHYHYYHHYLQHHSVVLMHHHLLRQIMAPRMIPMIYHHQLCDHLMATMVWHVCDCLYLLPKKGSFMILPTLFAWPHIIMVHILLLRSFPSHSLLFQRVRIDDELVSVSHSGGFLYALTVAGQLIDLHDISHSVPNPAHAHDLMDDIKRIGSVYLMECSFISPIIKYTIVIMGATISSVYARYCSC